MKLMYKRRIPKRKGWYWMRTSLDKTGKRKLCLGIVSLSWKDGKPYVHYLSTPMSDWFPDLALLEFAGPLPKPVN